MSSSPAVSIGLPVRNGEGYISSALDSLLAQSFSDFELIISDNASTDSTFDVCTDYARRDRRITLLKNDKNVGMVRNFRRVFQESQGKYFMWGSDHDIWHPEWLEKHVAVLDENPDVVLAYPLVVAIDADDKEVLRDPRRFETVGMGKRERTRAACTEMKGAGNMVYGLFRAAVLARTSVYPASMMPDRLLLLELSVHGAFKLLQQHLWYRRYIGDGPNLNGSLRDYPLVIQQQRDRLFANGSAPWHSRLPTVSTAVGLLRHLTVTPPQGNYANAWYGPYMAYLYLRRQRRRLALDLKLLLAGAREGQRMIDREEVS